jgi:hypothetical protein
MVVLARGRAGCGVEREAAGPSTGRGVRAGGRRSKSELVAAVAWKRVRALVLVVLRAGACGSTAFIGLLGMDKEGLW